MGARLGCGSSAPLACDPRGLALRQAKPRGYRRILRLPRKFRDLQRPVTRSWPFVTKAVALPDELAAQIVKEHPEKRLTRRFSGFVDLQANAVNLSIMVDSTIGDSTGTHANKLIERILSMTRRAVLPRWF